MRTLTAEDIYPDDVNVHNYNGIAARKGTVSAILANIDIIENSNSTDAEKDAALQQIKEYAPVVIATGLHKHVTWNNKIIQEAIDNYVTVVTSP